MHTARHHFYRYYVRNPASKPMDGEVQYSGGCDAY
jgi:hypothetical protein